MAMTSNDPKYYRVNLRINEETNSKLKEISKQRNITIAEYVRVLINGDKPKSYSNEIMTLLKDIFTMASLNGISNEDFLKILDKEMTDGTLIIENGRIKSVNTDLRLDEFYEVCHEVGADPQKMINETIKNMIKGR